MCEPRKRRRREYISKRPPRRAAAPCARARTPLCMRRRLGCRRRECCRGWRRALNERCSTLVCTLVCMLHASHRTHARRARTHTPPHARTRWHARTGGTHAGPKPAPTHTHTLASPACPLLPRGASPRKPTHTIQVYEVPADMCAITRDDPRFLLNVPAAKMSFEAKDAKASDTPCHFLPGLEHAGPHLDHTQGVGYRFGPKQGPVR